jgi:hypothetical protein
LNRGLRHLNLVFPDNLGRSCSVRDLSDPPDPLA